MNQPTLQSERFFNKVTIDLDGCWEWNAASRNGYGCISVDGTLEVAHRFSYRVFNGELKDELHVHHTCENRSCIRPSHLQAVTHYDHIVKLTPGTFGYECSRKTHCPQGHPYNLENTYIDSYNKRYCRACRRLHVSNFRERERLVT